MNRTSKTDFCESNFTENRDQEWDFSRKFLRVENENESSQGKIESWEWEWEFWGEKWDWNWEWDSQFSRMGVWLRLKVHLLWLFILKSLLLKHQNCNEILKKLPLKLTKFHLDVSNFWEFENESWEWEFSQQNCESRLRMRWEFFWESQFRDQDESLAEV